MSKAPARAAQSTATETYVRFVLGSVICETKEELHANSDAIDWIAALLMEKAREIDVDSTDLR
jgi:hypothetical protein